MFLEIILSLGVGIFCGIITGLIPGIHINLISALIVSYYGLISGIPELYIIIFIFSMSITHTFLDSIPSIYLGIPDPDMALSILPGHKMVLEGKASSAVNYTLFGSLGGLLISIIVSPILFILIPLIYNSIKDFIGFIILVFLIIIFLKDKKRFLKNILVFFLAGVFGLIVLDMNLKNPMFHLFTGLFGISNLALSLNTSKIPKQKECKIKINKSHKLSVLIASFVGVIAAFLPGMGSSQSAILGMSLMKKEQIKNPENFLTFIGGINTVNMFVSLITFYTINKARNGSIIALQEIAEKISFYEILLLFGVALIVGSIAVFLGRKISKKFSKIFEKINYKKLIISIISLTIIISFVFDGLLGLAITIIGTALGIFTSKINVAKSYLMGCLLLQVLIFFLF